MDRKTFKVVIFSLIFFIIQYCVQKVESTLTEIVYTDKGPVQGVILSTVLKNTKYSAFKGIPYAKPPVGKLRFKPPVPIEPWKQTLQAVKEGQYCLQLDTFSHNLNGSENCLFLNVYTPKDNVRLIPVMVWIHGGSFKSGSGDSDVYGPDFLIEDEVVVVTCNYRLGALGFLALNSVKILGNAALKDQNLALRWVNKNIIHFGGDPDKITIFGQSAGAASVDFHALSDMSKGLFHQTISMSASPFCVWVFQNPQDAKSNAFKLAKMLKNYEETTDVNKLVQIFENASAEDIVLKTNQMKSIFPPFTPSLENEKIAINEEKFLTKCFYQKYLEGNYSKVPHITGFTSNEAILFVKVLDDILQLLNEVQSFITGFDDKSIISKFIGVIGNIISDISKETMQKIITVASEAFFIAGIDLKQKIMTRTGTQPIYYYRNNFNSENYSYHTEVEDIVYLNGTSHGDDLPYLFYMSKLKYPLEPDNPLSIVRSRMVKMFTNFAKYGNPTPIGTNDRLLNVTWPPSGLIGAHLEIGDQLVANYTRPINNRVELFEKIIIQKIPYKSGCIESSWLVKILQTLNPLNIINTLFT